MVLRSLRLKGYYRVVWHVAKSSIFASGKVMVILRILGCMHRIWAMQGNQFGSLSVCSPCLGSQGPGGGVVLGLEPLLSTMLLFFTCFYLSLQADDFWKYVILFIYVIIIIVMIVGLTVTVVILVICCYTTVCMVGVCIDVHNMCAIDTELQEIIIMIIVEVFMPDLGFSSTL